MDKTMQELQHIGSLLITTFRKKMYSKLTSNRYFI